MGLSLNQKGTRGTTPLTLRRCKALFPEISLPGEPELGPKNYKSFCGEALSGASIMIIVIQTQQCSEIPPCDKAMEELQFLLWVIQFAASLLKFDQCGVEGTRGTRMWIQDFSPLVLAIMNHELHGQASLTIVCHDLPWSTSN